MKFIIHDLIDENEMPKIKNEDCFLLPARGSKAPCLGCFGCWIKTPSKCVLKDRLKDMGGMLASCDELIIISQSNFACFSPDTKNVIDRAIPYILPFFKLINKEMHHVPRYKQQFKLSVYIYNEDEVSTEEKEILQSYINAMSININVKKIEIIFAKSIQEVAI